MVVVAGFACLRMDIPSIVGTDTFISPDNLSARW